MGRHRVYSFHGMNGLHGADVAAVIKEEDGFWKEVLDVFFEDFMALLFPEAHAGIDWAAGFQIRDKELPKLDPKDKEGARIVDKLIEVKVRGGEKKLVMVHIEVQSNRDSNFARRMFVYHYRIRAKHAFPVANFALLADKSPAWRPDRFEERTLGTHVRLEYSVVKLLEFRPRREELSKSNNLFALLILAILKAQETTNETEQDMVKRAHWKLQAVRSLYERGLPKRKIRKLLKFVDWVVRLPEDLGDQLHIKLAKTEEEKNMTYVTSFERFGIKKGVKQGRLITTRENILEVLAGRFGTAPEAVVDAVEGITDIDVCKKLLHEAIRVSSMEDFDAELKSVQ